MAFPGELRDLIVFAVIVGVPAVVVRLITGWHWGFALLGGYAVMMGTMLVFDLKEKKRSRLCNERIAKTPCTSCGGSFSKYSAGPQGGGRMWMVCAGCGREVAFTYTGEVAPDQDRTK